MSNVKKLIIAAVLLALVIILTRFLSIQTPFLRIGFSFIPIIFAAIFLGPVWSTIIAGVGDVLGMILFPSGPFFLGFTVSAILTGLIYGLFLYNKNGIMDTKKLLIRLTLSSLIVLVLIGGILNSFWLFLMYDKGFMAIMPMRIVKELIMLPIQVIVIFTIEKAIRKPVSKLIFSNANI